MKCHICDKEFTISEQGIGNHTSDSGGFDFDADGDHVPYILESDVRMVYFDFVVDSFIAVSAPEGTDPDTLHEQAIKHLKERLAENDVVMEFRGIFDPC